MQDSTDLYNHYLWATKKITDLINTMTEEQFIGTPSDNSRSIRDIILHLVSIYAYFSSFDKYNAIVEKSKEINKQDLINLMRELSKKVYTVLNSELKKMIPVKTIGGTVKNITGFSLFHMLTDHFAYHRGQIITIFKDVTGKEGVGTDYALYLIEDNPDIDI